MVSRRNFLGLATVAVAASRSFARSLVPGIFQDGAKLICLSNRGRGQMFSAVFVSPTGHVAVVDGGEGEDAEALLGVLSELGGVVDYWFITHNHHDHYGALERILDRHFDKMPKVGELRFSFPPDAWFAKHDPNSLAVGAVFQRLLARRKIRPLPLKKGDIFNLDGGTVFEVLNDYDLSITRDPCNNSSICLSVKHGGKSVLVTGDLGVEGGDKLLREIPEKLPHDIVFAAHHGQSGVKKSFYVAVKPSIVIWPTTDWLWDNDASYGVPGKSQGPGSGIFQTNYVKCWFQELGVKKQYLCTKDWCLS